MIPITANREMMRRALDSEMATMQASMAEMQAAIAALQAQTPMATRVYRNSNQSIPSGGYVDVSFTTAAYQTGATFWTSGATVTIPATGLWLVFAEGTLDGAGLLAAETGNMQVLHNGTTTILEDERTVAIGGKPSLAGVAARNFTSGDTLKMQVRHSRMMAVNLLAQVDHSPDIILIKVR